MKPALIIIFPPSQKIDSLDFFLRHLSLQKALHLGRQSLRQKLLLRIIAECRHHLGHMPRPVYICRFSLDRLTGHRPYRFLRKYSQHHVNHIRCQLLRQIPMDCQPVSHHIRRHMLAQDLRQPSPGQKLIHHHILRDGYDHFPILRDQIRSPGNAKGPAK